jgi:hypothetical protein
MHCRRNSLGDQCERSRYLRAAEHQIDSRVSSAPVPLEYSIERLTCAVASRLDAVMVG